MARRNHQETPLLDHCDGADADDRAALVSAFLRIWRQQSKRTVTDLHVREFVLAVYAVAKGSAGVQWSYEEIADRLLCTYRTARSVVQRATTEFGLVACAEERYLRGGQGANRYSIAWQTVRSVNAGLVHRRDIGKPDESTPAGDGPAVTTRHPVVITGHPGAATGQAAVTTRQPYKESTSISTSISTSTHSLTECQHRASVSGETRSPGAPGDWSEVVSELERLGMGVPDAAITAAQSRELMPADCLSLIDRWERLRARQHGVTIGWLYRWITGQSVPPEEPEPQGKASAAASSLGDRRTKADCVRIRTAKELGAALGVRLMLDDPRVLRQVARRLEAAGLGDLATEAECRANEPEGEVVGCQR